MTAEDFFNLVRDTIAPAFRKEPHGATIVHAEKHHDGTTSSFSVRASARCVAFSMDVRGTTQPLAILNPAKAGLTSRNDLTVVCLDGRGNPLVFVFEHKNSTNIGDAQFQIESGVAFCEYLFKLLEIQNQRIPAPRFFGIAVYRLKQPPKGTTGPSGTQISFTPTGPRGLPRAYWHMDICLPLTELIRAAEQAEK